jgi:hypothetical protein
VRRTADEVIATPCPDAPAGAVITAAIVIYQYVVPGEDDEDHRGPFLAFNRDSFHGMWNQLGMIQSVSDDLRQMLRNEGEE